MLLYLFGFLVALALALIIIGLVKPSESAQALIGFFFLFLLAFPLMGGEIEYETGAYINSTYSYNANWTLIASNEVVTYQYTDYEDSNSFKIGLYLAIASAIGFAGVLFSLRNTRWREE